jgi:phospholipid/cholesterol/gamma-HCH transport system substrate-binding protein
MLRSRAGKEGLLGLFALLGLLLFGAIAIWLRGGGLGQKSYKFFVTFGNVSGLQIGSPANYRGVTVGKITNLQAGTNGVEVTIEIESVDLRIPANSTIQTSRYGLIGEAAIDITPPPETLSPQAQAMNPLTDDCNSKLIICNNNRLQGDEGAQLFTSLTKLSKTLSDPDFINNLKTTLKNIARAADRIAILSENLTTTSRIAGKNIDKVSQEVANTSKAVTNTANNASELVENINDLVLENRGNITKSVDEVTQLVGNLNTLVVENRGNVVRTLNSIEQTSNEVRTLAANLQVTVKQVNRTLESPETEQIVKNLDILMANAAETSANIRDVSKKLNDPATILTLQQTLNAARATFENAQKITSDVDELIGDPTFRENLRKLVNGLSTLVSSTQQLGQQVQTAQALESAQQVLVQQLPAQRWQNFNPTVNYSVNNSYSQPYLSDSRLQTLTKFQSPQSPSPVTREQGAGAVGAQGLRPKEQGER